MFTTNQKRKIADEVQKLLQVTREPASDKIQKILRATKNPELPDGEIAFVLEVNDEVKSPNDGEIKFLLHVDGATEMSWADIRNNGNVPVESCDSALDRIHRQLIASM